MDAKIFKILPHKYLDCNISVWLDSNIHLITNEVKFVDRFLGNADIGICKHPLRNTIKEDRI